MKPLAMLLFAVSAFAQTVPNPWFDYRPLAQLKAFLQLSDVQLQTILAINDEYNRWSLEKQARIRQVQSEIAEETAKETLDPNALGLRYAEIEGICREMKDKAVEHRARNVNVLNQDQKAKLKVLEDAMKLAPAISEAQSGNLLGGLTSGPAMFTSTSMGVGGPAIGGIIGAVNGCYLPIPSAIIRAGDFTGRPAPPSPARR